MKTNDTEAGTAMQKKRERLRAQLDEVNQEIELLGILEETIPFTPGISNVRKEPGPLEPAAWLSFHAPAYDPSGKFDPLEILQSLERSGFEQIPASLCRWDDWRKSTEPAICDNIPDKKGNYTLTSVEAIAPVWIEPNHHTKPEVRFYARKGDRLFHINVELPGLPVYLSARRQEFRGGWRYEPRTARVDFPLAWHSLQQCQVHQDTRGYVDTEQGISGRIYFQPHMEQADWPLKASEFVALLMETSKPKTTDNP